MSVPEPKEFGRALGALMGHCSVLSVGVEGSRSGLIVMSSISLSQDPPQLVACVNRSSSSWPLLTEHRRFGWNALGAAHQQVGEHFAGFGGVKGEDRYAGADWEITDAGVSLLVGSPVAFECELVEAIDRGEQSIVIGQVTSMRQTPDAGALVYWNGSFQAVDA